MMDALLRRLEQEGLEHRRDVPLAPYTTFKIGGPCPVMILPHTREEVARAAALCREEGEPFFVLGNGSNVLVSDEGFPGAVILFQRNFAEISLLDKTTVYAQAGASLMRVCAFAQQHGLSGLEFAYGIPASAGGAVYMNAGAYGGEMKDVLAYADYLDEGGAFARRENAALELSYRHSFFSGRDLAILGAAFSLRPGDPAAIRQEMDEIYARRKEKQPLEFPSAGSTFKRPAGAYAAQLIEECGLKGRRVGGAQVSEKHSGFVINRGGATCREVRELIRQVQETVREQTGFQLECEVRLIGPADEKGK